MDLSFLHEYILFIATKMQNSFNPCSYGSFVLTVLRGRYIPRTSLVSILVLMDLSFLHSLKEQNSII